MLRAAVVILPVNINMASGCHCCTWLCRLCCCCCACCQESREKSPLLAERGSEHPTLSQVQVLSTSDGVSETQTVEMNVMEAARETEVKDAKPAAPPVPPQDPSTAPSFVRGSSGRTSWRVVPHAKPEKEGGEEKEAGKIKQEKRKSQRESVEVQVEFEQVAPVTAPPPKDFTLVPYEGEGEEEGEGEGEGEEKEGEKEEELHISSFSFTASEGVLTENHH